MSLLEIPLKDRNIGTFLRRQADRRGDRPFMTIAERTLNFAQTDMLSRAFARGLSERGIGVGGRVLIMLPNCVEFVLSWFGASLRGAAAIPINPTLKGVLLEAILRDAQPDLLVVHGSLVTALAAINEELLPPHIVVVAGEGEAVSPRVSSVGFESMLVMDGTDPEAPADYKRIQMISYTSGTTGPSKGVMICNAAAFCPPINYIKIMGMTEDDSIYAPLPLFHGMSGRQGIMPSLVLGTHITIDEGFSASRYWLRAAACKATLGTIVHSLVGLLAVQPPRDSDGTHGMRAIFNTKHDAQFEDRFKVRMVEAYSLTETSHLLNTPYPERRFGSTGRVNDDWEVRLVDGDDLEVPVGETGELICRPRQPYMMMSGYLNKPEATLEACQGLWYRSGDLLRRDEDGYFFYIDRKKDRIRRRGQNVSTADVEMSVIAHPDVSECAIVPYAASDGEDHIRAIVILQPERQLAPQALHEWLSTQIPKFMLPQHIEIVDDIPRTQTGKFEKQKLVAAGLGPTAWSVKT